MGRKKKSKDPARKRQQHPQESFKAQVSDAMLAKVKSYVDEQIQGVVAAVIHKHEQAQKDLFTRIRALEEAIIQKTEGITRDYLVEKVVEIEDRSAGFENIEGPAEGGDRVRVAVKMKTFDQEEFSPANRLMVEQIGSGLTLGPVVEEAIVGMSPGEEKELEIGEDKKATVHVFLNKVSRRPKKEEPKKVEAKEEIEPPKESVNADSNAGQ